MTGDRKHVVIDPAELNGGDVIIGDQGVYYAVVGVDERTVTYGGGVVITYADTDTVTVLR